MAGLLGGKTDFFLITSEEIGKQVGRITAIFSVLLQDFEFELVQPSETYRDDYSKMVIQLQRPCRARYKRREPHGG